MIIGWVVKGENLRVCVSLIAGQFVDKGLLLCFHLSEALIFDSKPLQFCLFFVEEVVELHHLSLPILALALPLVPLTQSSQFFLLDLNSKIIKALGKRGHSLIHGDDLGDELH